MLEPKRLAIVLYSLQLSASPSSKPSFSTLHPPLLPGSRPPRQYTSPQSSPNEPIEQCPRQHKPTSSLHQPSTPKLHSPAKVLLHAAIGSPNAQPIDQGARQQAEEDVENEAGIGLEPENASADAEKGCGYVAEVGNGLGHDEVSVLEW